ncbi:hypothetical protein ATANTOWER_011465 [Ataeniobius toweri]|uniref:Uncharacterized protein n=1 Tax=Ataeniobius toweri TaxID=208326 RepID=A0ABU7APM5_9TELE|nr:hypothetical protein [Ataeniobius toweri]
MNSRRRPAGGVQSAQGDPSPSGTVKKSVSSEEEIIQGWSSRREKVEIECHQKQRYQQHGGKRRFAATSAGQAADEGTKQSKHIHTYVHTATSRNIRQATLGHSQRSLMFMASFH